MVRYVLDRGGHDSVDVFSKKHHLEMVEFMYRDDPKINVISINPRDANHELELVYEHAKRNSQKDFLRVGHEFYSKEPSSEKNCWEYFYEQLNIPHHIKVDYFKLKVDRQEEQRVYDKLNPNNEDYIFVHDESSTSHYPLKIESNLKVIKNDSTENAFYFTKILREAKEIHVVESSFKCMLDLLDTQGKLYYHDREYNTLGKTFKEWEIVRYEN